MKEIDETLNAELNKYTRKQIEIPETWEDKEWVMWANGDNGECWYTVLDTTGLPSDDNIIEGSTGERFYLDRDDACQQWGENVGLISLDNGLTFETVAELDDDEIAFVIKHIEAHDPKCFHEINALCDELHGLYDNDREWLTEFMRRLCQQYVI